MAANPFVIFISPPGLGHAFRVAGAAGTKPVDVPAPPAATPDAFADAAAGALATLGYAGGGVVLAVPSAWCLCASVASGDLPARGNRATLVYRLEEKLPVSAEDVVADFIPAADGATALGVCVEKKLLAPFVESLESRGVAVEAICPASLLALQHLLAGPNRLPDSRDKILLVWPAGEGWLELFTLQHGTPRSWTLLPDEAKDLLLHLGLAAPDPSQPRRVAAIGLRRPLLDALAGVQGLEVLERDDISADLAATATAGAVLAGDATPWVNLRRDELAVRDRLRLVRGPLVFAAAAAVLCVLTLCGAMLWRAHRYERLAVRYADERLAAFRQVFPDQPLPLDVTSRLASEERALRGVSGGDGSAPPPESPGLLNLRDLIAHLPTDVRYRVLDVRLDAGRFTVEGQALSHGDADAIAGALRRHPAFEVEAPRTEQLTEQISAGAGAGAVADTSADAEAGAVAAAPAVSFTITGSVLQPRAGDAAGGRAAP